MWFKTFDNIFKYILGQQRNSVFGGIQLLQQLLILNTSFFRRKMWYEALPSLFLTGFCVYLPYGIIPVLHKFFQDGNAYSRLQNTTHDRFLVRRDTRLTGDPYILKGLESIPD